MATLKWDLSSIKQKTAYVENILKFSKDEKEIKRAKITLMMYSCMIWDSGTYYTRIYNIINKLSMGKLVLSHDFNLASSFHLFNQKYDKINENYAKLLFDIASNLAIKIDEDSFSFSKINSSEDELIEFIDTFYKKTLSSNLSQYSNAILTPKNHLFNFVKIQRRDASYIGGACHSDFIYNVPYCYSHRNGTLYDYLFATHETMHGIDFFLNNKTVDEFYYGFHETPSFVIEQLLFDYMIKNDFHVHEAEILSKEKEDYIKAKAICVVSEIRNKLYEIRKLSKNISGKDIMNILDFEILTDLLEIKSYVIACMIKNQISTSKDDGIKIFESFMSMPLPKNKTPNFSFINLPNNKILNYSNELSERFMGRQKTKILDL